MQARGFEEGLGVVGVLFDAGGDGEDVGIEDDVFGRESRLLDQQMIGARADLNLALGAYRPAPARRTP